MLNPPASLATLAAFQRFLGLPNDSPSDEAVRQWAALGAASALLELATRRRLLPLRARLAHRVPRSDRSELLLRADLLELYSLSDGDGQLIPLGSVVMICEGVLHRLDGVFWDGDSGVQVDGLWGWHPLPEQAWQIRDSLQASLSAGAELAQVADADAPQADGLARFQVGQLLRLDDELAWVLAVDATQNRLRLLRSARGTTAQAHASGAPLAVYQPPADLHLACLRLAAWCYRQPDQSAWEAAPLGDDLVRYVRLSV
ncbi:MAG: hypothetical protein NZ750_08890 [Anaerolineae bacterium]|nr:hypothetical protein [Anaerolineae bacterium]MDW8171733.1 hypothetical protein [Anaerolineae bacterium]